MSSVDSAFWFAATPGWHMHIGALAICDPRQAPGFSFDAVRDIVGSRLSELPRLRYRVAESPLGLDRPWLIDDDDLDLAFHARHIAISYLPEALNTYLSIPAKFATTKVLENGKTAVDTFKDTIAELETKVRQLGDDLAAQDAHAFLVHSKFLNQKFGPQGLDAPALNLPSLKEPKS